MDRQYGSIAGVGVLRNWAEEKGYAYKTYNSHSTYRKVTHAGKDFICSMEVELKQKNYRYYPYMDTFKFFNPDTGIFSNFRPEGRDHFTLCSSDGSKYDWNYLVYDDYDKVYRHRGETVRLD